jgi:hypothetical protein
MVVGRGQNPSIQKYSGGARKSAEVVWRGQNSWTSILEGPEHPIIKWPKPLQKLCGASSFLEGPKALLC